MVALRRPVSKKITTNRAPQGPPVHRLFAVGRAYASTCLWELRERKTEATSDVGVPSRCKIRFVLDNTKTAFFLWQRRRHSSQLMGSKEVQRGLYMPPWHYSYPSPTQVLQGKNSGFEVSLLLSNTCFLLPEMQEPRMICVTEDTCVHLYRREGSANFFWKGPDGK